MLTLLSRLFMNKEDASNNTYLRQFYGTLCSIVGIALNVLLFLFKFLAGTISHSISITADSFNNLSDAGSSVITLIGFRLANQKPDPDHPFGHGRIEYLSGLLVSVAVLLMAVELIRTSFDKILHPSMVSINFLIILILVLSICVKCYMAYYNFKIGKKINSSSMKATATDSLSDTIATFVVLISSLFTHVTGIIIDGYTGMLVGCFILYAGITSIKETIDPLLGQPADPDFVQEIETLVLNHKAILGIHDLVVHDYGPGRVMISLHAEVPAKGDILLLHDEIDQIEAELRSSLHCDAVIHMDPIMNDDPETMALSERTLTILHSIDATLQMHDFRIVKGPTHTNLIFDILVPFGYHLTDQDLKEQLNTAIKEWNSSYFAVIHVDKKFV